MPMSEAHLFFLLAHLHINLLALICQCDNMPMSEAHLFFIGTFAY